MSAPVIPEIAGDDVAWCAAFVGACLERARYPMYPIVAGALIPEFWTGNFKTPGWRDRCFFYVAQDPVQGHVGFVIGEAQDQLIVLGGNQSHSVSVITLPRARLLGLRWPLASASDFSSIKTTPAAESNDDNAFNFALAHVLTMEGGLHRRRL